MIQEIRNLEDFESATKLLYPTVYSIYRKYKNRFIKSKTHSQAIDNFNILLDILTLEFSIMNLSTIEISEISDVFYKIMDDKADVLK